MPRPPRRIEANLVYHVLNRGNGKRRIFNKDEDYLAFINVLNEALSRYRVDLLCFCLMDNHWHLVLRPRADGELSSFMRWLTVTHVRRHHGRHGQASGHLYQGRFKCFPVGEDDYFLSLCRYVEANPLRAGQVKRAETWPWSSLHQRVKRSRELPLSDWPLHRPRNWTALVNESMDEQTTDMLRQCLRRDRPLGSGEWLERIAARLGLTQKLRPRGRPRKPLAQLSIRQQRRRKNEQQADSGHKDEMTP